ncbi:hypothetical protein HU742_014145 [Pseudomonas sp. SWRI102]|uniref:Uncharacterized protein n=1 Tax=Pseudomonas marvdashtae TaxID=2745500 RepID=A0A923FL63_9PSED|nr:hypothetical protein [Pseudomonas marvdashtae]MBV4552282.1 hypothetical protein [Pseudomonas marvdashtae]
MIRGASENLDNVMLDNVLDINDLDQPIYRIFPQWALEEALRLRCITLVPPSFWEDPFEVIESRIAVQRISGGKMGPQMFPGNGLHPIFAQSWSATMDSDTLLRAYSRVVKDPRHKRNLYPGEEGVRVRSTPRKLFSALIHGLEIQEHAVPFIGKVRYLAKPQLIQHIANEVGGKGPNVFHDPVNRAKLLMMKRAGFAHEDEVRLVAVFTGPPRSQDKVLPVTLDTNRLFDEVTFDPRLEAFELKNRIRELKAWGYTGLIGESDLYESNLIQVLIPDHTV